MSGSVSGISEYGLRGQVIADGAGVQRQIATLTQQAASGYIAGSYAGLGAGARVSLDLSPEIAQSKTIQTGIAAASGPLGVTQSALTQITQVAQTLFGQLDNLNGLNPSEIDSVAAQARGALAQVAGLLDSQDGATYVFAGQDSGNPPVPRPDAILSSGFYTQIATSVAGLSANGGTATAAATLAIAASNAPGTTPFSPYLTAAAASGTDVRPTVETGPGTRLPAGIAANANADIASGGTSTTGSYTRDILRALATIGALGSGQASDPGLTALVQDTRSSLGGAIAAIGGDAGVLGNRQAQLTAIGTGAADTATALKAQLSDAQDADLAATSTALAQAQTQLQASYQLLAGLNKLSLVNYL